MGSEEPRMPGEDRPGSDAAGVPDREKLRARRRRSLLRERYGEGGFLAFVGIVLVTIVLGMAALAIWRHLREQTDPVPTEHLFAGRARLLDNGRVEIAYDFAIDRAVVNLKEACPQLRDWKISGTVDNSGVLVSGDNRLRPFFDGGGLSVECDAAIAKGSQIAIDLVSIYDYDQNSFYRFELSAPLGPGWPALARIVIYREGRPAPGVQAELPGLKVSARPTDPPIFYRMRFELAGGRLRGWFAPAGSELVKYCDMPAGDLKAGLVILRGPGSLTAFDNVVVTGRPHPECLAVRTKMHYLLYPGGLPLRPVEAESPPAPQSD